MCCSPWGCRESDTAQQPNNNEKGGTGSLGIEAESQGCYITLRTGYTTRDCPPGGYQGPQLPTRMQEASQSPMMHRVQGPAHAPWGSLEAVRSWPTSPQGSASGPRGVSHLLSSHPSASRKSTLWGISSVPNPRGPGSKHQDQVPSESQEEAQLGLYEGWKLAFSTESRKIQPPARCRLAPSHLEAGPRGPSPHTSPSPRQCVLSPEQSPWVKKTWYTYTMEYYPAI